MAETSKSATSAWAVTDRGKRFETPVALPNTAGAIEHLSEVDAFALVIWEDGTSLFGSTYLGGTAEFSELEGAHGEAWGRAAEIVREPPTPEPLADRVEEEGA